MFEFEKALRELGEAHALEVSRLKGLIKELEDAVDCREADIEYLKERTERTCKDCHYFQHEDYNCTGENPNSKACHEFTPKLDDDFDIKRIIRCKNCQLRKTPQCAMQYECKCGEQHTWENDWDYCSFAVRRKL